VLVINVSIKCADWELFISVVSMLKYFDYIRNYFYISTFIDDIMYISIDIFHFISRHQNYYKTI